MGERKLEEFETLQGDKREHENSEKGLDGKSLAAAWTIAILIVAASVLGLIGANIFAATLFLIPVMGIVFIIVLMRSGPRDYHGQAEDLSQGSETNEVVPGWGSHADEPMKRVAINLHPGAFSAVVLIFLLAITALLAVRAGDMLAMLFFIVAIIPVAVVALILSK